MRQLPVQSMDELLGKQGVTLWKKANGIDPAPVVPYNQQKAIATEKTFDLDTQNIAELKALLVSMVEKVAFQLRMENKLCAGITVKIRYSNQDTETRHAKIAFTSNDDVLIRHAHELFDKLYQRRMLIRLIGVKLAGMVHGNQQIDLFQDNIKMIRLYQAMDRMKHRFNDPTIIRRATGFSAYEHANS